MSKTICVPKSLDAEHRLDYDQNLPGDLIELEISQTEFDELWSAGFFKKLNDHLDVLIDEFEDEMIGFEKLDQAIELVSKFSMKVAEQVKELMYSARKYGVGIYFYFN